jgi:hypothetical protein
MHAAMLVGLVIFAVPDLSHAADVQRVFLGNDTLFVPRDWMRQQWISFGLTGSKKIESRPSETPYEAEFVTISLSSSAARELYPKNWTLLPDWLAIRYLAGTGERLTIRDLKEAVDKKRRDLERQSLKPIFDAHGFWNWRGNEYILLGSEGERPQGQPLNVRCDFGAADGRDHGSQPCQVSFFWTDNLLVRYRFDRARVSEAEWLNLDRQVRSLITFLTTPK